MAIPVTHSKPISGDLLQMNTRVALLLFWVCATALSAEFRGEVRSWSGEPLSEVSITATHIGTRSKVIAASGSSGEFVLPVVHLGEYVIHAELRGFKPFTMAATLGNEPVFWLPIGLEAGQFHIARAMSVSGVIRKGTKSACLAVELSAHPVLDFRKSHTSSTDSSTYSISLLTPGTFLLVAKCGPKRIERLFVANANSISKVDLIFD